MYVHHSIHDIIFTFVGTLEASQVGVNPSVFWFHFCTFIVLVSFLHLHTSSWLVFMAGLLLLDVIVSSCSTGRCFQQNQQESAGAAAEGSGSQTRVQVCSTAPLNWLLWRCGRGSRSLPLTAAVVFLQHQLVPSQERAEPSQPADVAPPQAALSTPSRPHRHPEPQTHR